MKFDFLSEMLTDNPYFSAGFGLMGLGVCVASARQALVRLAYLMQKKFLTSLEINSRDPSYYWVLKWLTRTSQKDNSKNLMTGSHFTFHTTSNGFILTPSTGIHYVRWSGKWIKIQRERERSSSTIEFSNGNSLFPSEYMRFTCIGNKSTWLIEEMIENIENISREEKNGRLQIYTHFASEWRPLGIIPQKKRPLSSVILQGNLSEIIVNDLRDFLSNGKWYEERGIPYRRGYLLYGPPGCGKSSFVKALASEFGYSISLLTLTDSSICDDRLNQLLHALPQNTILLLEDVDAIMTNNKNIRLTLSGLLNALDGVAATEERVIFMTTNNYQVLPDALIRPGRVDMALSIEMATKEQSIRMFRKFYNGFTDEEEIGEMFQNVISRFLPQSPATIQNLFIKFKDKPKKLIEFLNKEGPLE